jgi:hypothetical protein
LNLISRSTQPTESGSGSADGAAEAGSIQLGGGITWDGRKWLLRGLLGGGSSSDGASEMASGDR